MLAAMSRAYLFLEAERRVFRCQFTKDLTVIGSAPDADIILRDADVHARHAQIAKSGNAYTLRAVDRAEVVVDGERLNGAHELGNGDRIAIGDSEILFVREAAEASTTVQLLITRPGEPLVGFWTQKSTVTIGRERGDVILDDPLLSRVHCVIENYCVGGQYLLDARSERGTALNGVSIDTRHRLLSGDVITIGSIRLEVRCGVADPGTIVPKDPKQALTPVQAAAERLDAVRAHDAGKAVARPTGTAPVPAVPRNPYQRYPSQQLRERDLESGVSTGLVDAARSKAARAESLPSLPPRPGWGEARGEGKGRTFGDDVSTRISHVGNEAGSRSGLWYLPGRAGRPVPVERPIIRPRGDEVPAEPQRPAPSPADPLDPDRPGWGHASAPSTGAEGRRPLIRRPDAAGLRPMAAPEYEPRRVPGAESYRGDEPRRPAAPEPRRVAEPEPRRVEQEPRRVEQERYAPNPADRLPGLDGPGARQERWYTPEGANRDAAPAQAKGFGDPSFYYLPGSKPPPGEDPDESVKREFRRPRFGGKTQGFDPSGGRR